MSRSQVRLINRRAIALTLTGFTATCSLLCSNASFADTEPAFTVRLVGNLPGGTRSWGMDVTPKGDVVGYATTALAMHGFYWNGPAGPMTDMGALTFLPGDDSYGYSVASTGYACGASEFVPGLSNWDAFVWWSLMPGMLPAGPWPWGHAEGGAYDIEFDPMNGLHRIVGYTLDVSTNAPHATCWDFEMARSTCLGTLTGNPADWSRAFGVNEFGEIVGMSTRGALPTHAFIYQNNRMTDIDSRTTMGDSFALSVNNASQVVGFWQDDILGTEYACRWQYFAPRGWTMTDLGCLPGREPFIAGAKRINDAALIVGSSWWYDPDEPGYTRRACMWLNDQIYDLNSLIVGHNPLKELKSAEGANINGQIVGYGWDNQGVEQAFILDPATLILNTPVPGISGMANDIYANGAAPRSQVHFVYSLQAGTTGVPGCPGLVVDLKKPKVITARTADAFGTAQLSVNIPTNAARTTVLFQAVETFSCRVSNRVDFTFH